MDTYPTNKFLVPSQTAPEPLDSHDLPDSNGRIREDPVSDLPSQHHDSCGNEYFDSQYSEPSIDELEEKTEALKNLLQNRSLFCSGTCSPPPEMFTLFYGKEGSEHRIDVSQASEEALGLLSRACEPATFGLNQEDVLDETYRMAGKLDIIDFATHFNPEKLGLITTIVNEIVPHKDEHEISLEMHKLNMYGIDAFFKPHKDTPRASNMFGSLVIVFPTPHEGGELKLTRDNGEEWVIDSAKALAEAPKPSISYVAFYSDIMHEVLPVKSGHRVTLTYNLFFKNTTAPVERLSHPYDAGVKAELLALLRDRSVLPGGGLLGFGLRHQYPVNEDIDLSDLRDYLKGSDEVLARACDELSLTYTFKILYGDVVDYHPDAKVLVGKVVRLDCEVENLLDEMPRSYKRVVFAGLYNPWELVEGWSEEDDDTVEVLEVTSMESRSRAETPYVTYGNEASLAFLYGDVCLMVNVEALENRKIWEEVV